MNYTKLQLSLLLLFSCSVYASRCDTEDKAPKVSSQYLFKSPITKKSEPSLSRTTQVGIGAISAAALCFGPSILPAAQKTQLRASLDVNNSRTQSTLALGLATLACFGVIQNRFKLQELATENRRNQETQHIINLKQKEFDSCSKIQQNDLDLLIKRTIRTMEVLKSEQIALQAKLNQTATMQQLSRLFGQQENKEDIQEKIDNVTNDLKLVEIAQNKIDNDTIDETVVLVTTQMQPATRPLLTRMFGWTKKTNSDIQE